MGKMVPLLFLLMLCVLNSRAQQSPPLPIPSRQDSLVGSITPERAWWDVQRYDLSITPDIRNKTLRGKNVIEYDLVPGHPDSLLQIDLVRPLQIDSVLLAGKPIAFKQQEDIWYLHMPPQQKKKGNKLVIYYSGKPTESVHPPWDGGLVWSTDSLGRPWISVACQYKGASLWYPCKNSLSDEANRGASISITVPDSLIAVSNGRLQGTDRNNDHTTTYRWMVRNSISHYAISFYIGKYVHLARTYPGERGPLSMDFWVLDYNRQRAIAHMIPAVRTTLKSLEHWFGPYPFYSDGFKMVDAPYIGMEHQSAIAYGSSYRDGTNKKGMDISHTGWGLKTDRIIVHEMAHEWFGNNITANDIADRWIQEGFAGLAEELVIADLCGKQAGAEFLAGRYRTIENDKPVIGRYGINEDGSGDNYMKGWAMLHMIRTIIDNDNLFQKILRGLNERFRQQLVSSRQIEKYIMNESGMDFSKIFDQYLRTAQVPVLEYRIRDRKLMFRYTDCLPGFSMPIRTNLTGPRWLHPGSDWHSIPLPAGSPADSLQVDLNFYVRVREMK